jgi:hypothetical protein
MINKNVVMISKDVAMINNKDWDLIGKFLPINIFLYNIKHGLRVL